MLQCTSSHLHRKGGQRKAATCTNLENGRGGSALEIAHPPPHQAARVTLPLVATGASKKETFLCKDVVILHYIYFFFFFSKQWVVVCAAWARLHPALPHWLPFCSLHGLRVRVLEPQPSVLAAAASGHPPRRKFPPQRGKAPPRSAGSLK